MRLAVIPARSGSKRIPRKNVKSFGGFPVLAWSIRAAIQSECFDRIIVSTDDSEIGRIAKSFGAEVPFIRPARLCDDYTGTQQVVMHAIEWQKANGVQPTEVCCIYATAPFLRPKDLQNGLKILCDSAVDYVFSVTNYAFPIQRALRIIENERLEMFNPEFINTRSQDLVQAWHDAGQFYWGLSEAWENQRPLFDRRSMPVCLPRTIVHDLDTEQDWVEAELLFDFIKSVLEDQ